MASGLEERGDTIITRESVCVCMRGEREGGGRGGGRGRKRQERQRANTTYKTAALFLRFTEVLEVVMFEVKMAATLEYGSVTMTSTVKGNTNSTENKTLP